MTKPGRNDDCPCNSGKKYKHCCLERDADASAKQPARSAPGTDLQPALTHFQAGRLVEAETICTRILEAQPNRPDVIHLLGVIALQAGMPDVAVDLLLGALNLSPEVPELYYNLGNAFREMGNLTDAATSYRQAVRLKPSYDIAWSNLGDVLMESGQSADAIGAFRQAIAVAPDVAKLHFNLGMALQGVDDLPAAETSYRQAIARDAHFADAHCNLGTVLHDLGQVDEAIGSFRRAVAVNPALAIAHCCLGKALGGQRALVEALACYRRVVELDPGGFQGYFGLGSIFNEMSWFDQAAEAFRRAIVASPDSVLALKGLGKALRKLGRVDEAEQVYRDALRLEPDDAWAYAGLADTYADQGKLPEFRECLQRAIDLDPKNPVFFSTLLFVSQYFDDLSPADLFAEHLRYAERFEAPQIAHWPVHRNTREPERKLKIGYVSGDFRNHSVAYFIEPMLASHDKSRFEIHCYYSFPDGDEVTARLKGYADHWLDCANIDDDRLAARILADGIDILIDLSGHTAFNRLPTFARKPAPVQITWLGMAGTTGLRAIDYHISDRYLTPPGEFDAVHSERLWLLPEANFAFHADASSPPVNRLPALNSGRLTFSSMNNLVKINDRSLSMWARIMKEFPGSRLMLGNVLTPQLAGHLKRRLDKAGISEDSVVFNGRLSMKDFLSLHNEIDLAFDPYPYPGGTTSLHALWMGVPVVTLAGAHVVSRVGAAAMASVGLSEFITYSETEYVERACSLCRDLEALDRIRQSLRGRMSHDDRGPIVVTRQFEDAYRAMWRAWCAA